MSCGVICSEVNPRFQPFVAREGTGGKMESEAAALLVRHDVARDDGKERVVARNRAPRGAKETRSRLTATPMESTVATDSVLRCCANVSGAVVGQQLCCYRRGRSQRQLARSVGRSIGGFYNPGIALSAQGLSGLASDVVDRWVSGNGVGDRL